MRAAFCGTQEGMTKWQEAQLAKTFKFFNVKELVYRDYQGSDMKAVMVALDCGIQNFHIYPTNDSKKRGYSFPDSKELYKWLEYNAVFYKLEPRQAPMKAGDSIVLDSEMLIATPKEFTNSMRSATWGIIRKAWHIKREVITIPPVEREDEDEEGQ